MLDTNTCLSFELSPLDSPPMGDDMEKAGLKLDLDPDRQVYHSLKEVLQLKLQQRRTREELVSQGIMPPLKSPAAFHEQRRSLERARTEDYLKRKIRCRPERSELVRMHILEETSAEPSLQAKQLQLKRARLADDLNDKISHRPGPIELVHKNILSVSCAPQQSPEAGGESSSLDEDSSDALSPDQLTNHDSPLSAVPQLSPCGVPTQSGDMSPTQFLTQPPPPPPPPPPVHLINGSDSSALPKLTNGTTMTSPSSRSSSGQVKTKTSSDRPPHRPKKSKDSKPKVKKLKYHQYIPPDQKADKERPPQMDSSYAKLLQQQQLFLQLQILSQQQQHYNYHTILPAPPKPTTEQTPTTSSGPSPSRSVPSTTTTSAPSAQSSAARQCQLAAGGVKPSFLPANLDEFKVAELKQELKLRGLTVSGTKNDLIERLRNYQEQNGGTTVALKSGTVLPSLLGANAAVSSSTSSSNTTVTPEPSSETKVLLASSIFAHAVPGRVMRFGSTSSSPPVSPSPSERSLAGMSPDETSCNGDMFGEMVSSPLTQLTLHQSPQSSSTISPFSNSLSKVKDEIQSPCSLSMSAAVSSQRPESLPSAAVDKDQMLQEKDKQIEELTRMLRQKQKLVETLRSQLEQGKVTSGVFLKKDANEVKSNTEVKLQTLIKASAIQPPTLPNGVVVTVKKEEDSEEEMEGLTDDTQTKKEVQPMQCSQETLLRLQQIHRLQVQQAEQQKQQQQTKQQQQQQHPQTQQQASELRLNPTQRQQKKEAQILLQQQQHLQQLIIQQTQQKQLLAQQKLAQQKLAQQKLLQQNQLKQLQGQVQQSQQKNQPQVKQVQVQIQNQTKPAISQNQQRRQLKAQHRQQQKQQTTAVATQQVTPVFINQQNGTQVHTQAISLDLLKANGAPTLVTDSNGNHYLIALTSQATEGQNGVSSLAKTNGRITLQRLQSTPTKLPSTESQSKEPTQPVPVSQPIKKGQKVALHLETNGVPQSTQSVTAPPNLQPFFDDLSESESQSSLISSLKSEELCPPYDRHTLFTPPSPKPNISLPTQRSKDNGVNSQQMDDLFDILLKSGEIPGFKANPDPSLAHLHSNPPSPSSPPSPLHLSPPTPPQPIISPQSSVTERCTGSGRLEDFLESTTGTRLLGMEPDVGLTLIDDLHSQMLSTPSILDHPPSPMDTSDLGFSPHSTGLDFGDPTLDSMDWLDISMVGSTAGGNTVGGLGRGGEGSVNEGDSGTSLAPLAPQTPPSVFSADFLDSTDLQLHWESCL